MRARTLSAVILVPVVAGVFLAGMPWLALGVAALAVIGGGELAALLRAAGLPVSRWPLLVGPAAAVIAMGWPGITPAAPLAVLAAAIVLAAIDAFRRADVREGFLAWSGAVFGIAWLGQLACLVGIVALAAPIPDDAPLAGHLDAGRTWLLVLVLLVWSFDTFAYLAGRAIGRGRFLNHISPKKTWSGVIGGTIAAFIVGGLLGWATGAGPLAGIVAGGLVAVAAQAGDVAASLVKRAAGAKDSGTLIPGHGGILDRTDSFLFAAPVLWALLLAGVGSGLLAP